MSNIVLRVRNYPWQWSEDFAKAYTLEELKDPVKLKYTGGSLIEIHQEFYINAIKKQVKDFFYPLAKNVRNDPFNYALSCDLFNFVLHLTILDNYVNCYSFILCIFFYYLFF